MRFVLLKTYAPDTQQPPEGGCCACVR